MFRQANFRSASTRLDANIHVIKVKIYFVQFSFVKQSGAIY